MNDLNDKNGDMSNYKPFAYAEGRVKDSGKENTYDLENSATVTQDVSHERDNNSGKGQGKCAHCIYADGSGNPTQTYYCEHCGNNKTKNKTGEKKNNFSPCGDGKDCAGGFSGKNPYENDNSVFEYTQNGNEKRQASGYSVASLVLGILSIVMCCNPLTVFGMEIGGIVVQFVCALLAVIFGGKEIGKQPNGIAKAGLIAGIVGIIFFVVQIIIFILCGMALWYSFILLMPY